MSELMEVGLACAITGLILIGFVVIPDLISSIFRGRR